jgi:thymidine kinase
MRLSAQSVAHSTEILSSAQTDAVIGIDEVQFFDKGLPAVVEMLARRGHRVVLAGLDLDAAGEPFERTAALLKLAGKVDKLQAVCAQCGAPADFTFRKAAGNSRILLGAGESYEPRCAACFKEGIRSTFW